MVTSLDAVDSDAVLYPKLCVGGLVNPNELEYLNCDSDKTSSIRDGSRTELGILRAELLGRRRLDAVNVVFVMVRNCRVKCVVTRNAPRVV